VGVIAELQLFHPNMVLAGSLEQLSSVDARLRLEGIVDEGEKTPTCFMSIWVDDSEVWTVVEKTIRQDASIVQLQEVVGGSTQRIYQFHFKREGVVMFTPSTFGFGIHLSELWSGEDRWLARIHAPSQDRLREYVESCHDRGATVEIQKLYSQTELSWDSTAGPGSNLLTEEQWAAMTVAYDCGYFDEPRECSLETVGEALGISPSAAGRRIRRATHRIVESMLETRA